MLTGKVKRSDFLSLCREFVDDGRQGEEYICAHEERLWNTFKVCRDSIPDGGKIISVGAGSAYIEHALHRFKNADITVVDFPEAIDYHRKYYARSNFKTIGCDLSKPWGCEEKFDLALSSSIIQHIPRPPYEHVLMLSALLKKNGKLVINTPNFANIRNVIRLILMRPIMQSPEKVFGEISFENEGVHRREYVPLEIYDAMKRCGLRVAETHYTENKRVESLKDYFFYSFGLLGLKQFWLSMIISATKEA